MGKRIVVNAGLTETRVAVQEGALLTELYVEREGHRSIVGSVHKGVVTNVLPGMQAAFVDIGLAKDAFLYVGDYTANLVDDDAPEPANGSDDDTFTHGSTSLARATTPTRTSSLRLIGTAASAPRAGDPALPGTRPSRSRRSS